MKNNPPTRIEEVLKLNYKTEKEDIWLTSQDSLRKLIGISGIALPLLLLFVLWIDAGYTRPLFSISHYYFTRASGVFVIIVSLLAIFLLIYKGKEPVDFYLSSVAGLFALCVVIFPTDNISDKCNDENFLYSLTILHESKFRPVFHYISAAIFLSCLAYMSLFLFTKSDKSPKLRGINKRRRNRIFRSCGVIMVLALMVILANPLRIISDDIFEKYHLMFWMETIAVESFGIAWLVKAEIILKG